MRLLGKTAIVTGGGSGFGTGIVQKFLAEGAKVMVADVNREGATNLSDEWGGDAIAQEVDITDSTSIATMFEAAMARYGHVDILVNNAGTTHLPGALEDIAEEDFDRVMAVNAKSIFLTARQFVPHFKQRRTGAILNIGSAAAIRPWPDLTWYNASKGFVMTATKSMAQELAPFGIRINALNPVMGKTPLLTQFMGGTADEAAEESYLAGIPLGRFSTPTDIGNAACFLCSDEAGLITGVGLEVDGGQCI